MQITLDRDALARRIDRCYRVAAWTKVAEKRLQYIERARHYRALFAPAVLAGPTDAHC